MPITKQQGRSPPFPRFTGFLNRVAAQVATHPKIYRAKMLSREIASYLSSKPLPPHPRELLLELPDEPACESAAPPVLSFKTAVVGNRRIVNRGVRSRNWSKATIATPNMVHKEHTSLPPRSEDKMKSEQVHYESEKRGRGPIVRFNQRNELLEVLPEFEEEKYNVFPNLCKEQEMHTQQSRRSSAATQTRIDQPSVSGKSTSDGMYILNECIEPETARSIMRGLGAMLHHVPFTIVGTAALVHYGLYRRVSRITLACPSDCVRAVYSWAKTRGMHQFQGAWSDSFGYKTDDSHLCRVRVRALYRGSFNMVRLPRPSPDDPSKVMTLPNIVNEYAGLYVAGMRRFSGREESILASDIKWMLRRITALVRAGRRDNEQEFTRAEVSWIMTREFWQTFTQKHPETAEMFRAAGAFRCMSRDAGVDCAGYPDKTRPIPPSLPETMFDAAPHEGVERVQKNLDTLREWTEMDDGLRLPWMPDLQGSPARAVSFRRSTSVASSRVASPVWESATTISSWRQRT